jgi:putative hydrolase of the HAD superfamily
VAAIRAASEAPVPKDIPQCLFLDVGGVLLSDGWDHHARRRAAVQFGLEPEWSEMEDRHHLVFEIYEAGKLTLDDYLDRVVFHRERGFSRPQFREFIFAQSQARPEMIELIVRLRQRYRLKIVVVSNEARELNLHRIRTFKLNSFVDAFVSSCFVHLRKPDPEILRLALDLAQTPAERVVMIDNTPMFAQIAGELGMRGIVHTDAESTRAQLALLGLSLDGRVAHEIR